MNLIYLTSCSSTNDIIVDYANNNHDEVVGVFTLNQTNGRGMYGNQWLSGIDKNIAYSVCVPQENNHSGVFFNYHTALIIRDFLAKITAEQTLIKWPNDIILKSKKIGGILIENKKINSRIYYIIGIGLNILQEKFDFEKAGSIFSQTGKVFDPKILAEQLHLFLVKNLKNQLSENDLLEKYNSYLYKKDKVAVFEIEKIRQNGIVRYADNKGFLNVELEDEQLHKFFHKEITMLY